MAVSWSSLSLSWSSPRYEFGNITGYKHRCKSQSSSYQSWNTLASSPSRSVSVGGFNPNDFVTCQIQVANSAGTDQIEQSSRTLCDKPTRPTFSLSEDVNGGYRRISVSEIQTNHNCESLKQILVKLYEGESSTSKDTRTLTSLTDVIFGQLDALILYKVMITAENNQNLVSEIGIRSVTTGILAPGPVTALSISAGIDKCVDIEWGPPADPIIPTTSYTYKCTFNEEKTTTDLFGRQCRYSHYDLVSCWVKAENDYNQGPAESSTSVRIPCIAPSTPGNINVNQEVTGSGANIRIRLSISWQAGTPNCGSVSYDIVVNLVNSGAAVAEEQSLSDNSYWLLVFPFSNFTITVSSVNNNNSRSAYPVTHIQSLQAAPHFGNSELRLVANSSTSVVLTWSPPQYEFGIISKYQYQCKTDQYGSWTDHTVADLPLRETVEGFLPFQNVTCQVMAFNSAGSDTKVVGPATTLCEAPSRPSFNLSDDAFQGSRRVWITNIQAEINCAELSVVTLKLYEQGIPEPVRIREYLNYIDRSLWTLKAVSNYRISINVTNNEDMTSLITTKNITTGELQSGPVHELSITARNLTCVSVTWNPPVQPNGTIISYRYRCEKGQNGGYTTEARTASRTDFMHCRYQPNNEARCWVEPQNTIDPTAASETTINEATSTTSNGLQTHVVTVSWQASDPMCSNVAYYMIGIRRTDLVNPAPNTRNVTGLQTQYQSIVAGRPFLITIIAHNNRGFETTTTKQYNSPELSPHFGNASVEADAISPYAVRLAWKKPLYDNGILLNYTYRCNEMSETVVRPDVLNATIYGFSPRTAVTCTLEAANTAGEDQKNSSSIHTYCAEPSRPTYNMSDEKYTLSRIEYRRLNISKISASEHNCDFIDRYEVVLKRDVAILQSQTIAGSHSDLQTHFSNLSNLNTTYTISAVAVNNQGNRSLPSEQQYSVGEIVIQPVRQLRIQANGPYCVELSWLAPSDQPNTLISNYHYFLGYNIF